MLLANWDLPHSHVGRRVEVFDRVDSTNSLALQRSRQASSAGLALLAWEQTAGRGQFGRTWQAPPGECVLLSAILFPPPHLRRPALLTAWAAVSVCEFISEITSLPLRIKWPNDVLLAGKKVCGILIEQRSGGASADLENSESEAASSGPATVAGIGLNLNQEASFFAAAELPLAGSLFSLSGQRLDSADAARRLLGRLDELYAPLLAGDTTALESKWRDRLELLGKNVAVEADGVRHMGRLREIGFAGLMLEESAGVLRLLPEAIRHVEVADAER